MAPTPEANRSRLPFSEELISVLATAYYVEAGRLRRSSLGTEHLVMALLADPEVVTILDQSGVSREELHKTLSSVYPPRWNQPSTRNIIQTPDANDKARQAISLAAAEAARLGQSKVGPGELLIGILKVPGQAHIPALVLVKAGLNLETARFHLRRIRTGQLRVGNQVAEILDQIARVTKAVLTHDGINAAHRRKYAEQIIKEGEGLLQRSPKRQRHDS